MEQNGDDLKESLPVKSLVVVFSYHQRNTEKIANACAKVLGAEVKTPQQVKPEEIAEYDLVGFCSGIYSATFDASVPDLANRLPDASGKKAFLFSTYGAPGALQAGILLRITTRRSGKSCRRKGTRLLVNSGVRGGTRTVS